jgi:hypothetical protein
MAEAGEVFQQLLATLVLELRGHHLLKATLRIELACISKFQSKSMCGPFWSMWRNPTEAPWIS